MAGDARQEDRDECLERFDDFQKCVLVSLVRTRRRLVVTHTYIQTQLVVPQVGDKWGAHNPW